MGLNNPRRVSLKRIIKIILLVSLVFLMTIPAFAAKTTGLSKTDLKLTELSNRVSSFEANWSRFQLGGSFSLVPYTLHEQGQPSIVAFSQEIELLLNAFIDQNIQFSLKLNNQKPWGFLNQYFGPTLMNPLQVDEAFLKLQYPKTFNYLGRFRFSLGEFGIISDFYADPVEGIAIQHAFGSFHLVGIYKRVNTIYNYNTGQVENGEDYLAGRIGWSNKFSVCGINFVPKGIGGERDLSMDWSRSAADYKIAAEFGWHFSPSDELPEPVPGFIVSYGRRISPDNYFQLKAGYFDPKFDPEYSSLDYSPDYQNDREWFFPNSKGFELYWLYQPFHGFQYQIENRLIVLAPVNASESIFNYRLHSSFVKNISPINQIFAGVDMQNRFNSQITQVFTGWTLRF
jgi:hypothetical protein